MKKTLSLALALVMVLSLPAFSVSAENIETKVVDVKWNFSYVGSSTNGGAYSNTDVFVVEKVGSKVTFTDNNKNGSNIAPTTHTSSPHGPRTATIGCVQAVLRAKVEHSLPILLYIPTLPQRTTSLQDFDTSRMRRQTPPSRHLHVP